MTVVRFCVVEPQYRANIRRMAIISLVVYGDSRIIASSSSSRRALLSTADMIRWNVSSSLDEYDVLDTSSSPIMLHRRWECEEEEADRFGVSSIDFIPTDGDGCGGGCHREE